MIKNIIFDMGGVLIRWEPMELLKQFGAKPEDLEMLYREIFKELDWIMLDAGLLDEAEAEANIARRLPEEYRELLHKLIWSWDDPISPMPGTAELVKELKEKGYGLYLLSNASRRQPEYWPRVPGHEYFDDVMVSAFEQKTKPHYSIYACAMERFGLRKEECVFIDDTSRNILAAKLFGMEGIVFFDAEDLRKKLRKLGVDV